MNKTQIVKALGVNSIEHDNYRHSCYERWCAHQAQKKQIDQRNLVNHNGLYRWYCTQWEIIERFFWEDNHEYIERGVSDPQAYRRLFITYPPTIHHYFPGSLLKIIERNTKTPCNEKMD